MIWFALLLALIWGIVWASVLSTTRGLFLAARYTWLTVVIGVGMDLLIGLLVTPLEIWLGLVAIVALSSIGIIARSLWIEHQDQVELLKMIHDHQDQSPE